MDLSAVSNNPVEQVREVLRRFQDGYTRRDLATLDEFMKLFVPDEELEVIGTGASQVEGYEWCIGQTATRDLVEGDWKGWGDVALDVEGARIYILGEVAWLATSATVSMNISLEKSYQDYLSYVRGLADEADRSMEEKLYEIARSVTNTLFELSKGEMFIWPLRFTAVLVRREGRWLFHQMQFAFPTTRYPDERLEV